MFRFWFTRVQVSGKFKRAFRPPVEGCSCHTCRTHTLAYLHHLFKANEPLGELLFFSLSPPFLYKFLMLLFFFISCNADSYSAISCTCC